MSLLTQIFAGPPPTTRSGSGGGSTATYGTPQIVPGVSGQEQAALVNTTVYRATSLISGTCAALPVRIIRRDDVKRTSIRGPAQRHIWGRPNPSVQRINLWESEFTACLLSGNAYIWRGQSARSRVTDELWYLRPSRVTPGLTSDGEKVFQLDGDRERGYTSKEILHIPALSTDGIRGIAPIDVLASSVNGTVAATEYLSGNYARNQVPPGILKTSAELSNEQADEIQSRWREKRTGILSSRDIAVLGHGAEFQAINVNPKDAENIATLQHWELRIAQAYGIPPHMLGIVDRSTSWGSGIEQQTLGFVRYTLLTWLERFEQAIEDSLLPADLEMKWDLSGLLRGDTVQRFNAYRIAIASGFMLRSEVRTLEDWEPVPGIDDQPLPGTSNPTGLGNGGGDGGAVPRADARAYTTDDADDFTEALYQQLRTQHYAERVEADVASLVPEARCPTPSCGALLGRQVGDADLWCKRCKAQRSWRHGELVDAAVAMALPS